MLEPWRATLLLIDTSGELAVKVWQRLNPYKMFDNIFYMTILPILNSNEVEVTD
jgi:hypothetical protein